MMYLVILVHVIPVSQFLNDLLNSDVVHTYLTKLTAARMHLAGADLRRRPLVKPRGSICEWP